MYLAKDSGMPHAIYTAELDHHDTASLTLLAELPRALRNRELVLHYQPKLDVHTGMLAGIEALIRWQHPTRGLIPPIDFVPAAEKTGLIEAMTRYVLDEALGQLRRLRLLGQDITVAVNLSMRNLHDPTLPQQVAELLHKWDLSGECLTLEITESAIVSDPSGTKDIIRQLRELGVEISIDDFGTGYSSLAYLADLPVSEVKIDRSFVSRMADGSSETIIVTSTITLAHQLGLRAIAEGVEDEAMMPELEALGCDAVQGYAISRPLSSADATRWLLSHQGNAPLAPPRRALEAAGASPLQAAGAWS
jgi:EAL domain-containing protein (putative c-di-GMP-specific phosphodiesterase class I)